MPYGQGWWGRKSYEDAKYPLVHLRTLFDWPHRPHSLQAENVLSWCEGMTSDRPGRVEACLDYLADPKRPMGADWSALWDVAKRLSEMDDANAKQKAKGTRIAKAVDELCEKHLAAIQKGVGKKGKLSELSKGDWSGRLARLVEDFYGVEALTAFQKKNKKHFQGLEKSADKALKTWWAEHQKEPSEAFDAGLDLLESGFLSYRCLEVHDQDDHLGRCAQDARPEEEAAPALERARRALHRGAREGLQGVRETEREGKAQVARGGSSRG